MQWDTSPGRKHVIIAKEEEDFKEWRDCILSELEDYVVEEKRFITREQFYMGLSGPPVPTSGSPHAANQSICQLSDKDHSVPDDIDNL